MIKQLKNFIQIGFLVLTGFCLCHPAFAAKKKAEPLDGIAAIVNESPITLSELNHQLAMIKRQMIGSHVPLPPSDILRKQVLDQLINKKLQLELAEHSGVNISDDELNNAINRIAQNNKMPIDELYKKIAEQGMNINEYHKEIREELTLNRIQQQNVASKITITPQEVKDFLHSKSWQLSGAKEYHLEDILIVLPEAPSPQQVAAGKKQAEATLAKIRNGMSFEEAAASDSGEANALKGGDLGWRKLPEIPTIFAEQLINMKEKDIAGPIQAANGFHVVRLAGIRSTGKPLDPKMQQSQVEHLIFQRKFEEGLQRWISKVRSESFIKIS